MQINPISIMLTFLLIKITLCQVSPSFKHTMMIHSVFLVTLNYSAMKLSQFWVNLKTQHLVVIICQHGC